MGEPGSGASLRSARAAPRPAPAGAAPRRAWPRNGRGMLRWSARPADPPTGAHRRSADIRASAPRPRHPWRAPRPRPLRVPPLHRPSKRRSARRTPRLLPAFEPDPFPDPKTPTFNQRSERRLPEISPFAAWTQAARFVISAGYHRLPSAVPSKGRNFSAIASRARNIRERTVPIGHSIASAISS